VEGAEQFESKEKCETVMSLAQTEYQANATARIGSIKKGTRVFALQMVFSECVSENNPDLKLEIRTPSQLRGSIHRRRWLSKG
jgi:hypothetical protein